MFIWKDAKTFKLSIATPNFDSTYIDSRDNFDLKNKFEVFSSILLGIRDVWASNEKSVLKCQIASPNASRFWNVVQNCLIDRVVLNFFNY